MYSAMAEFFSKGGAFMYPIALVFVLGVAIASERYLYLTLSRARNRRFWQQLVPLLPMQDQLAALRDNVAVQKAVEARNLSGRVGEQTRSERSLVTSGVGVGSGGIDTSTPSRGYGGGAGSLDGHATTHVAGYSGSDTGSGQAADDPSPGGSKPARSREEIELVFDRNKSAIYALYSRAAQQAGAATQARSRAHDRAVRRSDRRQGSLEPARRSRARAQAGDPRTDVPLRGERCRDRDHHQAHRFLPGLNGIRFEARAGRSEAGGRKCP